MINSFNTFYFLIDTILGFRTRVITYCLNINRMVTLSINKSCFVVRWGLYFHMSTIYTTDDAWKSRHFVEFILDSAAFFLIWPCNKSWKRVLRRQFSQSLTQLICQHLLYPPALVRNSQRHKTSML